MLNISEETAIQKVLEDMTDEQEVFTSVDVANKVKKDGTWIRNRDVASYLRKYFPYLYVGEYTSTPDVVIGNGIRATVYHPISTDPVGKVGVVNAMTPDEFEKLHGVNPVPTADAPTDAVDVPTPPPPAMTHQTMAVAEDDDVSNTASARDRVRSFFERHLKFPKGS